MKTYFSALDLVRFFAAFLVLVLHFSTFSLGQDGVFFAAMYKYGGGHVGDVSSRSSLVFTGSLGVQIFFVVSGLVISISLVKESCFYNFIINRFFRIYPLLIVASFLSFFVLYFFGVDSIYELIGKFLRSIVLSPVGSHLADVVWTLTVEFIFYISVGLYFYSGKKGGIREFACIVCWLSAAYWIFYFSGILVELFENKYFYKITTLLFIQHGCFFSIGMFSYLVISGDRSRLTYVSLGISLVTSVLQVIWTGRYYYSKYGSVGASGNIGFELMVWLILLGLFFWAIFFRQYANMVIHKLGVLPKYLGLASYPMYLIHSDFGLAIFGFFYGYGYNIAFFIACMIVVIVSIALAIYVEPLFKCWLVIGVKKLNRLFIAHHD